MARIAALLLALPVAIAAWAPAAATAAPVPRERALYAGPDGRYLLEREWTTRADPEDRGLREAWQRPGASRRFDAVTVPHSFNARDRSEASFRSRVQWYRLRFRRPPVANATGWRLRFESVAHRADVFLNGRRIGSHVGAHLPFELDATALRPGDNELVVRVDGRLGSDPLSPATRPRGWWNHGGILREVYLRRVRPLDLGDVHVRSLAGEPAIVTVSGNVRNATRARVAARLSYRWRGRASRGSGRAWRAVGVPAGGLRTLSASFRLPRPQLWSPEAPNLYELELQVPGGQVTRLRFGVRELTSNGRGQAALNGRLLSLRGASFHEQTRDHGAALTSADREQIVTQLRAVGADFTRQHYPPHPALLEAFDRAGILFWEQVPLWRVRGEDLADGRLRAAALERLRRMVLRDRSHPSVMTWSVGNEVLRGGASERAYMREAIRVVRRLDPLRFVGVDTTLPVDSVPRFYRELDALGVNEYLGWYGAGSVADVQPQLERLRARVPGPAIFVTEFGAEANREGPEEEKGTFAFQRSFLDSQLDAFAGSPHVNGALVWSLRDFAVRPGWRGGNPSPAPPVNTKGLFDEDGRPKPALEPVATRFRSLPWGRRP